MKYGVNTMVWTTCIDQSRAELFSRIKAWGFDGVEMLLSPRNPLTFPRFGNGSKRTSLNARRAASYRASAIWSVPTRRSGRKARSF